LSGSSSPIAAALECRACAPLAVTRKAAAGLGWWPGLAAGWGWLRRGGWTVTWFELRNG
jgi:hypothetical protein